jgi:hypothetical protein
MPSNFTDMLNTMMGLKQLQNQNIQIAQQGAAQATQGIDTFMKLAQHTANPTELTALVERFSQLGIGSPEQLTSLLQHVTPTQEATRDYMTRMGIDIAAGNKPEGTTAATSDLASEAASVGVTGMNAGQRAGSTFLSDVFSRADRTDPRLAAGLASRTATGMTPGDMSLDALFGQLPAPEQSQAAGVKAGTRLSASADASNQLGWAGLRQNERQMIGQQGYQMGQLEVDAAKAKAAAAGKDPQVIVNLIDAKQKLLATLQNKKNANPTQQEILSFIGGFNAINLMMSQYGLPNEGQLEYNADTLLQPGALDRFLSGPQFMPGRQPPKATSQPTNVQPSGAGRR